MKIAVLGAAGQLGRAICPLLKGEVVALTRTQADLTRPVELRQCLQAIGPQLVVNCSAYNLVDRAESEADVAFAVNAWGVRELAAVCRDLNAKLVHFSTDYVFGLDALRRNPWKESDAPGPVSAYGLSKLTGEYWVRQISDHNLVIRTCGLYGPRGAGGKGGNFVETMLRLAGEGKPLRVIDDQRCTPSYVADVAQGAVAILGAGGAGLFHLTNDGDCSWHEFAAEIFRVAVVRADLTAIASVEYRAAARRPAYSVLAHERADALGIKRLRPWREALAAFIRSRG